MSSNCRFGSFGWMAMRVALSICGGVCAAMLPAGKQLYAQCGTTMPGCYEQTSFPCPNTLTCAPYEAVEIVIDWTCTDLSIAQAMSSVTIFASWYECASSSGGGVSSCTETHNDCMDIALFKTAEDCSTLTYCGGYIYQACRRYRNSGSPCP